MADALKRSQSFYRFISIVFDFQEHIPSPSLPCYTPCDIFTILRQRSPLFSRLFRSKKRRTLRARQRPQARNISERKRPASSITFRRRVGKLFRSIRSLTLLLFFFGGVIGIVFLIAQTSVQHIAISRSDIRVDAGKLGKYMQQYMGRSILFLSQKKLESQIQKRFPQIKSIRLQKQYPNTIRIIASAYPIVFRWGCEREKKEIDEQGNIIQKKIPKLYYVDANGMVSIGDESAQDAFLVYEKSPCPKKMSVGYKALSAETVRAILAAKKELENVIGRPIVKSGYYRDGREIHFYDEKGTSFWIDFMSPPKEQIQKFKAAVDIRPQLLEPMDHIDLRITDKIFYAP